MFKGISFTIPEILSLIGVAQCLYILVYMIFRSGRLSRGTLPAIYFAVLGLAFLFDAAFRFWHDLLPTYDHLQWLFWFSGPPLSMLLVIQIAQITKIPDLQHFLILLLIPMAYLMAFVLSSFDLECGGFLSCNNAQEWLNITGLCMGGLSLLAIWSRRDILDTVYKQKGGRERFWLIIALIILNVMFLMVMLALSWRWIDAEVSHLLRSGLGIAFVYTASTSLLRIYPQAMRVDPIGEAVALSDEEITLALKIEQLLHTQKVYQEPNYGRADMAKELNISESLLSRIVNQYFEKSVPQLLNELRVKDAQLLLEQTGVAINIIAEEAGFNSLASFNRVFKDMTGRTPSEYRKGKTS